MSDCFFIGMISSSRKIGRNTIFNALGKAWLVVLNLAIVPFIFANLGAELYGIWALVLVVSNAFTFFDFGIGTSIVKFVSQYLAVGNSEKVNKIVSNGTFFFVAFSVLFCMAIYPILPWLAASVFQIPLSMRQPALFALRLSLLAFFLSGLSNLFQSVLYAAQKMGIVNAIVIGISILQTLGIFLVLHSGLALNGLIINHVFCAFGLAVCTIVGSHKTVPLLAVKLRYVSKETFGVLFSYGSKLQVGSVTSFLIEHLNKIFVVSLADLQAVAMFDIAMKAINVIRLFPTLLLSALVPSISEFYALGEYERLRALYVRGEKYLISVSVPIVSIAILAAVPVITLMFGSGFEAAARSIQILAVAYGFNLFTGMGTTFMRGIGRPELEMYYALVIAVLNIALVYVLGSWFGYFGILAAMSVAIIAGSVFFLWLFHRVASEIFGRLDGNLGKSLIVTILPTLFVFLVNYILTVLHLSPPHYAQIQPWFVILVFLPTYIFVLIKYRFFDAYDRDFLRSIFLWR